MKPDFTQKIEKELVCLSELKNYLEASLAGPTQGTLRCRTIAQKPRFIIFKDGREAYIPVKNTALVKSLLERKFKEEQLKRVAGNIDRLNALLKTYQPYEPEAVYRALRPAYRYAFSRLAEEPAIIDSAEDWAAQPFETNPYLPEEKKHILSGGLRVRSKSEALIAEYLRIYQIPFRYEAALEIGGKVYYPDFTVRRPCDKKIFYWEHCGLTAQKKYLADMDRKLQVYRSAGITPWNGLILTYDDEMGSIDLTVIRAIICALLLPDFLTRMLENENKC